MKTIQYEARKHTVREMADATWRLSLDVHPDDFIESGLVNVKRGTRFMVVMAPIDDDEQPIPEEKKSVAHTSLQERVHILAKKDPFHRFIEDICWLDGEGVKVSISSIDECLQWVRDYLEVDSLGNLTPEKKAKGNTLLSDYARWASRPMDANEN